MGATQTKQIDGPEGRVVACSLCHPITFDRARLAGAMETWYEQFQPSRCV